MNTFYVLLVGVISFFSLIGMSNAEIQQTYIVNANQMGGTCFAGLAAPIGVGNLSVGSAGQILTTTGGVATWGSAGTGSVTSISQGTGIISTPNPLTTTGSIAFNTTWGDLRYALFGSGSTALNTWINGTGFIYPNSSLSNNINTTGYINASRFTGKINCSFIDGGTDSNYCVDSGITVESDPVWLSEKAGYLTTESDPRWQGNYSLVAFTSNQGNWNVNSSTWWAGLSAPLASWTDTHNATYDAFLLANYSAKTDYINNATERALFTSTFNATYDAKPSSTYNATYHGVWTANYSAKTDYVNNMSERNLFLSTYNSTYDAKPSSTYNATYDAKAGTGNCPAGQFVQNTTTGGVVCLTPSTFNSSYLTSYTETDPRWQGNYSLVAFKDVNNVSNSTLWWSGLSVPLASWTSTFNSSYDSYISNNYSAKTDYVNNATERALFLNTFNSSYMTSTFNSSYDAKAGTGTCASGQFTQNTTTGGVQCATPSTFNSSYLTSETLWQGNSSAVLGWNKTYADTLYYALTNPSNFWNNTWAGFNKTYADTLYAVLGTKTGNTTSEIQAAINSSNVVYNVSINSSNILNVPNSWTTTFNSSYMTNTFNQTYHTAWIANYSAKTDYVNNATERALFLNTFNSSYLTSTFNATYDAKAGTGTCAANQFAIATTTGGVTCFQPTGANITDGTITTAELMTGTLAWGNISGYNLFSAWTNTLGGGNITDNTLSTSEFIAGTLNQANLTNTVAACSNQFSRGMSATTQNCATVGNGDMTSGAYAAITGLGAQSQNLDMNNKTFTNVVCINASNGNSLCLG